MSTTNDDARASNERETKNLAEDEVDTTPSSHESSTHPEHPHTSPLSIDDMTVAYHRKPVLWDIDFDATPGSLTAIVGPNGAGKSTLIKAALDLVPRASGRVQFYGKPYRKQRSKVGYVPQRESVDWDFPVDALDVVTMGLYRNIGWCLPVRKKHRDLAMQALDRVGIADLAFRQISQLSGGQQQRTFLARALVQDADLYLMDEPFAGVDAATERAILDVLEDTKNSGRTLMVVHHDLATAAEYFDSLVLLKQRLYAYGPPEAVLHQELLSEVYEGKLRIFADLKRRSDG